MNIDGYALIRVHDKEEEKGEIEESKFFDIRLECCDLNSDMICNDLVGQLPEGLKDVLVMCFFSYRSESSYDYWSGATEYEDCFDLQHHQVVKENYKEFYHQQITEELDVGIHGIENVEGMPEDTYYKKLIGEWEEFYDEEFKLFEKTKKIIIEGE